MSTPIYFIKLETSRHLIKFEILNDIEFLAQYFLNPVVDKRILEL